MIPKTYHNSIEFVESANDTYAIVTFENGEQLKSGLLDQKQCETAVRRWWCGEILTPYGELPPGWSWV